MIDQVTKVLRRVKRPQSVNQTLALIASEFVYTKKSVNTKDLIEDLRIDDSVRAIAVVDEDKRMVGIVVRRNLSTLMLKPYAQDVLKQKPVNKIMKPTRIFSSSDSIFVVAEQLQSEMLYDEIQYYLISDSEGHFAGIFSTLDLLNYLSQLLQRDVTLAARLQKRIVKEREFMVGRSFEYISSNQTAKGVGGDFTSIQKVSEDDWLISLCDVSGKGVAASVITSVLWGMMNIYDFTNGLLPFIKKLNDYLVKTFEAEKFITALFLELDERKKVVRIFDMGHSHIFLIRNGKIHQIHIDKGNLPLGIMPGISPNVSKLPVQAGDLLFLITDGLIEQENKDGEIYDIQKAAKILLSNSTAPVENLLDLILRDFRKFREDQILNDDVSMTLLRFAEQELVLDE
jgi:sigma-B regulation protein RsbU (phosphoserine phosphatase)